MTILCPTSVAV